MTSRSRPTADFRPPPDFFLEDARFGGDNGGAMQEPEMSDDAPKAPVSAPGIDREMRERIIARPAAVLEDVAVMRALVEATETMRGPNVVDLRGVAMDRLETRLNRLEDTHRTVIAAAYENLAGTQQIHRAVLRLLEPTDFVSFLGLLQSDLVDILRVGRMRLILESVAEEGAEALRRVDQVLAVAEPGFIDDYLTLGRGGEPRRVTLRALDPGDGGLYGDSAGALRSEALLRLDFGAQRYPGLLAIASCDADQFAPNQGTDLLDFLAGAFERAMRRWLE